MFIRILLISILFLTDCRVKEEVKAKETFVVKSYILNKDSVDMYPLEEVMAAIAYHECFN